MPATMYDPRWTYRWKQIRTRMCRLATHCALCHRPLMHDAPARTRWSPSLDHVISIQDGGQPFDIANLRVVHFGCNGSRGASQGNRARGRRGGRRGARATQQRVGTPPPPRMVPASQDW